MDSQIKRIQSDAKLIASLRARLIKFEQKAQPKDDQALTEKKNFVVEGGENSEAAASQSLVMEEYKGPVMEVTQKQKKPRKKKQKKKAKNEVNEDSDSENVDYLINAAIEENKLILQQEKWKLFNKFRNLSMAEFVLRKFRCFDCDDYPYFANELAFRKH